MKPLPAPEPAPARRSLAHQPLHHPSPPSKPLSPDISLSQSRRRCFSCFRKFSAFAYFGTKHLPQVQVVVLSSSAIAVWGDLSPIAFGSIRTTISNSLLVNGICIRTLCNLRLFLTSYKIRRRLNSMVWNCAWAQVNNVAYRNLKCGSVHDEDFWAQLG